MCTVNLPRRLVSLPWKGIVLLAVGLLTLGWLLNTPEGLLGKADAVGYAVCHRIDLRSFHIGVRQMPLCARCSGMYLGAMLGLVYLSALSRRRGGMPSNMIMIILGALVAAFVIDGINSFLSAFPGAPQLYQPQNWLRLLTGTGMGIAIAAFLYPAFNQTVWKDWDGRPALGSLRSLAGLVLLAALLDLLMLSGSPLVLYPLALLSAAGVLVLLTIAYGMLWLIVLKAENRYQKASQLLLAMAGGFGLAMIQIIALDFVRYWITGTWDGFHFG